MLQKCLRLWSGFQKAHVNATGVPRRTTLFYSLHSLQPPRIPKKVTGGSAYYFWKKRLWSGLINGELKEKARYIEDRYYSVVTTFQ